jgi:hypothetical protein
MRKLSILWFLTVVVALGLRLAYAQDDNKPAEPAKPQPPKTSLHAYRIDFAINELEDGKKINTRRYTMNLNAGDRQEIKIGTRVPVATGSYHGSGDALTNTQFQYLDVGTRINCGLQERGDDLGLEVHGEFSNFSSGDQPHGSQGVLTHEPIIRQISISGSTLAVPGKTAVIGVVEDPNSNREFQLEAIVTKLR